MDSPGVTTSRKMIAIANVAAIGKTEVLKRLTQELTGLNGRIVCYFTMNEFVKQLSKNVNEWQLFEVSHVKIALSELCCFGDFEQNVLKDLLTHGTLELLLDGLDEVGNKWKEMAFKSLQLILSHMPQIRIWIASRDHLLEDIYDRFGCLGYKLEPPTYFEQAEFLIAHWKRCIPELKGLGRLALNDVNWLARECLEFKTLEATGAPLVCQMIAEIYEEKVRNIIRDKDDLGLSPAGSATAYSTIHIYEQMIERRLEMYLKVKKDLRKFKMDSSVADIIREEVELAHIYFGLKLLFSEDVATGLLNPILVTENRIERFEQTMLEVGILDNLNPLAFIHRSFAEYFVALFFYNIHVGKYRNIKETDANIQNFLWTELLAFSSSEVSCLHLVRYIAALLSKPDLIPKHKNICKQSLEVKNPVTSEFFYNMWEKTSSRRPVHPKYRHYIAESVRKYKSIIKSNASIETSAPEILTFIKAYQLNPLYEPENDEIIKLFLASLKYAFCDLAKMLIENEEACHPSNWSTLRANGDNGSGILHMLLTTTEPLHLSARSRIQEFINYVVTLNGSVLEERNSAGRTPLFSLILQIQYHEDNDLALCKYFVKTLGANVNATDNDGNTLLHSNILLKLAVKRRIEGTSIWYCSMMDILMEAGFSGINHENNEGDTPLLALVSGSAQDAEAYSEMMHILGALFKYGADPAKRDKNGNNAIHRAAESVGEGDSDARFSICVLNVLIRHGVDVSAVNYSGQCALFLAVRSGNMKFVRYVIQQHPRCLSVLAAGETEVHLKCETVAELRQLLCGNMIHSDIKCLV